MNRSCDKCGLEFQREHDTERMLFIDMERTGWYVDEVKCICSICIHDKWKPDSHRCKNCGKPVFTAWYRQKFTNFNAAPHSCGYEINYTASRPHRVVMVGRTYWGLDAERYAGRPEHVYVQHRCRKKDIASFQGQRMWHDNSLDSPVNQLTYQVAGTTSSNNHNTTSASGSSFYHVHHTASLGGLKSMTQSSP